jgi:tRNA A-37 threonylcarbamoyl transferase component Bud32
MGSVATGDTTRFNAELQGLLRSRLRTAALIFGLGCALFWIKSIFYLDDPFGPTPLGLALHGVVAAVSLGVFGLLALPWRPSLTTLRAVEGVFFIAAAGLFTWHHLIGFGPQLQALHLDQAEPAARSFILHLVGMAVTLRWVILVVIYGTFIPNTWRHCALVVGFLAGLPLVLTVISAVSQPLLGPVLGEILFVMAVLMLVAAAIAVFGSYRITELRQKAIEAEQLGQYHIIKQLGLGGMGSVYLAEHALLQRLCAVKIIRPDQLRDPKVLPRFEREVRSTAQLTHPNTVEIYDYGREDDGTFYYAMEYLPGPNLEEMVTRYGSLPPGRVVHFLRQMCGALREAHAKKLIHRDIKPSNILVCERGKVPDVAKLLDFGLVQPLLEVPDSKLSVQGAILGSPPYMSPEQAAGKEVDARCDIYCLGGVAYFLLTGRPPFIRETAMQLLLAHAYEPPRRLRELREDVPEDLERVVLRCLEKDPNHRFPNVEMLDNALEACGCSGDWTEEQAAAWWAQHSFAEVEAAKTTTSVVRETPGVGAAHSG